MIKKMKIAVPVTRNNQVDNHFGHCEFYNLFTISPDNEITEVNRIPSTQGCGCKSNIAGVLASDGVKILLAGGIGNGAINVLNNSGISVIRGCTGDSAEVVRYFLLGSIEDSGESCHQHDVHHADDNTHQCSH
jgi:predicted Fe-Mo cluster-binding NifX family protein